MRRPVRGIPVRGALAGGLRLPRLRQQQGVGAAHQVHTKAWTWECAGCGKQTSVTAGTIMHHSKLPLTTWFWAAYLMATHSNGISALQLQRQLALGSYKTAWLLCAKLRRSMVAPGRSALAGLVEVDETEIACRSKHDPVTGGGGRSHQGKMLIVGAVEVQDGGAGPGRIRLAEVSDYSANSLHPFVAQNLAAGATAKTDGWSAYPGAAPGWTRCGCSQHLSRMPLGRHGAEPTGVVEGAVASRNRKDATGLQGAVDPKDVDAIVAYLVRIAGTD